MKKFKPPSFLTIMILTIITIVFWIFFGVVRIFSKAVEQTVPAAILTPLSPTLDKNVLDSLPSRVYFDDSQIPNTMINVPTPSNTVQQVTPTPTEIPTASESALPTETPVATEGGSTQ